MLVSLLRKNFSKPLWEISSLDTAKAPKEIEKHNLDVLNVSKPTTAEIF